MARLRAHWPVAFHRFKTLILLEKFIYLPVVFRPQKRTGNIGQPPLRAHQRGGFLSYLGLQFVQISQRFGS